MSAKDITMVDLAKRTTEFEHQVKSRKTELSSDDEEELFADFLAQFEDGVTHPVISFSGDEALSE